MAYRVCCSCGADLHDSVGPRTSCIACRRPTSYWLVRDDRRIAAAADGNEAMYAAAFAAKLRDNRNLFYIVSS